MNNPKKIYLSGPFIDNGREVQNWCDTRTSENDVEYVRAGLVRELITEYEDSISKLRGFKQKYPEEDNELLRHWILNEAIVIKKLKKIVE